MSAKQNEDSPASRPLTKQVRGALRTPLRVKLGDSLVSLSIAVGGISTILLLLLVVVVLFASAVPLLSGARVERSRSVDFPAYRLWGMDDRQVLLWGLDSKGNVDVWDVGRSRRVATFGGFEDEAPEPTCFYQSPGMGFLAVGFDDGTARVADISISESLVNDSASLDTSIIFSDRFGRTRQVRLEALEWSAPVKLASEPIVALDWLRQDAGVDLLPGTVDKALVAFKGAAEEGFAFFEISQGGVLNPELRVLEEQSIAVRWRSERPMRLMMSDDGKQAFVAWPNGVLDLLEFQIDGWKSVESEAMVDAASDITVVEPTVSRRGLMCGTENGDFVSWTIASRSEEAEGASGLISEEQSFELLRNHLLSVSDSSIVALKQGVGSSVAYALARSGEIVALNPTIEKILLRASIDSRAQTKSEPRWEIEPESRSDASKSLGSLIVSQDGRSVLASLGDRALLIDVELGGVESSWSTFFGRVWYEGYDAPGYVWQSSSAQGTGQPKLSLIPLFLGSVKATLFAMLFSAPIGLMAAVYSNECLSERWRERIRPLMETMAGIPGVIIGFIVAIIIGPVLSDCVLFGLVACVVIPLTYYFCGRIFGLMIQSNTHAAGRRKQGLALLVTLPISVLSSWFFSLAIEAFYFPEGFVEWVQSGRGSAFGGWLIVFLPLLALLAIGVKAWSSWQTGNRLSLIALRLSPKWRWLVDLAAIPTAVLLVMVTGWSLSGILTEVGWDVRDGWLTGFQDRNALLVGFALGFCTIPVIYSMAADALLVVPDSQRNAALACGATTWQCIVTIVLPTARSGLIAAVLTGLGRVAGETMIVLMVVGNTPLIDWNPFSGLQSITATLATELPLAVIGSTHYRTLFLAALLLFLFTLAINTLAEVLRVRARREIRSY